MATRKPTQQTPKAFFGEYWNAMVEAHKAERRPRNLQTGHLGTSKAPRLIDGKRPSSTDLWDAVEEWWPIQLLQEAAEKRDAEGFKRILSDFLRNLHAFPPKGVLVPFRWKRGRRKETENIYAAWLESGRPETDRRVCDQLAKQFYPEEYTEPKKDGKVRKKLRDRIRATIRRHDAERATKSR